MTSMMSRRLLNLFGSVTCWLLAHAGMAQLPTVENSIFWEVSGNGLEKSSYLFGSHHLMGSQYVDTLANVQTKFDSSSTIVCEVLFDSTHMLKMIQFATMKDTTLDQLLPPEWYRETETWLAELSEYDQLSVFNRFNPATVQVTILQFLHEKIYGRGGTAMDIYLQEKAKTQGKTLTALETVDEQLEAFFHSTSYRKQADLLIEFVDHRETAEEELIRFNQLYLNQNLSAVEIASRDKYTKEELYETLDARNERWLKILPAEFSRGSTFVVVGALHLAGENGLVNHLRKLGYYVTPISLQ